VINPDIIVDRSFTYEKTLDTIREAPTDIDYRFANEMCKNVDKLEYSDTDSIQIIKLNHVGGNPRTPIPLTFHYSCACGNSTDLTYEAKTLLCDDETCGRKMTRSPIKDVFFAGYASQVVADDLNNLPILSLVPIPLGEFNAAVFIRKNKAGYYLFMISVDDIVIESSEVQISNDEHAIWQLIRLIDQSHEERLGKCISGMEWYKAAILLSYLANAQHYTSLNVLAVGAGGTGKTSVARFILATLTQQFKLQDALSLSSAGVYGSTSEIKVGDTNVTIPEAGLLARYQMVIVDEVYSKGIKILPVLRSTLRASTLNKEVATNRTSIAKNACVIGTSNPMVEVLIAQQQWKDKWLKGWKDTQERANVDSTVNEFVEDDMHASMVEEWIKRDLDWHTGQQFPDLDRWALIFFIKRRDKKLKKHHLNSDDMKIDDLIMSKMFYNQSIHDYFVLCSGIKVDYEPHADRILDFIVEIRKQDVIHSDRIGQDVTLMLQLSAQINGRSEITDEDFDFVGELWSKTCEWVYVEDLARNPPEDTNGHQVSKWTIQTIKKHIHEYMHDAKGTPYYGSPKGFAMVASKLEDAGAPAGLVENTIEHYKENPNQ
jgi:hypothetical protein